MNVAVGLAPGGDLLVISSGWSNRYPADKKGAAFRAGILEPWVCRSSDGGRTWTVDRQAFPARGPRGGDCLPFGDILPGADGQLRVAIYEVLQLREDRAYVYRSPDGGKTWGEPTPLDAGARHYASKASAHDRYHMGVAIWDPDQSASE